MRRLTLQVGSPTVVALALLGSLLACRRLEAPLPEPSEASTSAREPREQTQFLDEGNFENAESKVWIANGGAEFLEARIRLAQGGLVSQVVPLEGELGELTSLRLLVEARLAPRVSVDASGLAVGSPAAGGQLRLQGVWLPEGGWAATSESGESLVSVVAEQKNLDRELASYQLDLERSEHAVRLVVYLVNDGLVPLEVFQARLVATGN